MKQSQSRGTDQPSDRADEDGDGVPDQSELDFTEAGHTQPQPSDAHPGRDEPNEEHSRAA